MASGKVLWFNKVKGYGAISSGDGERLYVDEPGLKPDVDKQELRNGSTWSVLRQSCKPRSPVGLVNPPANKASAKNNLALAA